MNMRVREARIRASRFVPKLFTTRTHMTELCNQARWFMIYVKVMWQVPDSVLFLFHGDARFKIFWIQKKATADSIQAR